MIHKINFKESDILKFEDNEFEDHPDKLVLNKFQDPNNSEFKSKSNNSVNSSNKNSSHLKDEKKEESSVIIKSNNSKSKHNDYSSEDENEEGKSNNSEDKENASANNYSDNNDNLDEDEGEEREEHKEQFIAKKKTLEKKDLKNRYQSKLACLIRKKYTSLMKESIKVKGSREKYFCCESCRKITTKILLKLSGTIFQAFISLLAVIIYVMGTYYPEESVIEPDVTIKNVLRYAEFVVATLIFLDYIYNFFTSKEKLAFLFNFLNFLDLVTVIPIYVQFIFRSTTSSLGFARIFRIVRVMRIFRVYKIIVSPRKKDSNQEGKNEITRRLIAAILTVLAVVFLSTGIVHYLNDQYPDYFRIIVPSLDSIQCQSNADFSTNSLEIDRNRYLISNNYMSLVSDSICNALLVISLYS